MSPSPRKPMNSEQLDAALIKLFDAETPRARSLAFAKVIGCGDRTVRKWCSGELEVPRHIAMLVNLMIKHFVRPEELQP